MTCFLNCCFHMFFQVRHPSPCHFLFPCLPVQVTAHCLFQAFNSHDCMFGRQLFYLWSAHSHKHHNSLAASSSRNLLLFPGCPPSHKTLFGCIQIYICHLVVFRSIFEEIPCFSTCTYKLELYYRDTETPAHSIPSTYPFCLSAWAHLLLPTIYTNSKILREDISIVP